MAHFQDELLLAKFEEVRWICEDIVAVCTCWDASKLSIKEVKKKLNKLNHFGKEIQQIYESDSKIRWDVRQKYKLRAKDNYMTCYRWIVEYLQHVNENLEDNEVLTTEQLRLQEFLAYIQKQIHTEWNHWKMKKNLMIREIEEITSENPIFDEVEQALEDRMISISKLKKRSHKSKFLRDQDEELVRDVYESLFDK